MAPKTYFVVQPFEDTSRGQTRVLPAREAQNADHARRLAERLAEKGGAYAYSRTRDPSGEFSEPTLLGEYGDLPEDAVEMAMAAA